MSSSRSCEPFGARLRPRPLARSALGSSRLWRSSLNVFPVVFSIFSSRHSGLSLGLMSLRAPPKRRSRHVERSIDWQAALPSLTVLDHLHPPSSDHDGSLNLADAASRPPSTSMAKAKPASLCRPSPLWDGWHAALLPGCVETRMACANTR